MGAKLAKDTYPESSTAQDFQCFGPPATRDGEFDAVKICDMGCFMQDGKDSNKYDHAAVVQHKRSKNWYAYFEWGRVGTAHPSFQFVACQSEAEAQYEFASQLHSKNDPRGEWVSVAGLRTLRARAGKDCYLVRPMATRSTGLPDARSIKINEGARVPPAKQDDAAAASACSPPIARCRRFTSRTPASAASSSAWCGAECDARRRVFVRRMRARNAHLHNPKSEARNPKQAPKFEYQRLETNTTIPSPRRGLFSVVWDIWILNSLQISDLKFRFWLRPAALKVWKSVVCRRVQLRPLGSDLSDVGTDRGSGVSVDDHAVSESLGSWPRTGNGTDSHCTPRES